jgi:hypothetical protein
METRAVQLEESGAQMGLDDLNSGSHTLADLLMCLDVNGSCFCCGLPLDIWVGEQGSWELRCPGCGAQVGSHLPPSIPIAA